MYPDGEALISLDTILDAASEKNPGVIARRGELPQGRRSFRMPASALRPKQFDSPTAALHYSPRWFFALKHRNPQQPA